MLSDKTIGILERNGWVIECESPVEVYHPESNSRATGIAVDFVVMFCEENSEV